MGQPRCIVTDLDRTLTGADLRLDQAALARIDALRAQRLTVIIATGRRLDELHAMGVAEHVDALVAENGAIIAIPSRGSIETAGADFAAAAREALGPLAARFVWGRVLGSGPRALAREASQRLSDHSVGHALEFNAEEVMLLPHGVNKARGVERCLKLLDIPTDAFWAIGDGENDASMLSMAAVGAAPANAVPIALSAAHVRLKASYSRGFLELTEPLVAAANAPAR